MTKQIDEHISAFMDGELREIEYTDTIRQLCHDDDLKARWLRYHLISDTLKNNLSPVIDYRFAQSVMSALENEPTILAPAALKHKATVKQKIAGAAIAASVAAVAVIGVQTINQPKDLPPSLAQMPATDQYVRMEQPLANTVSSNATTIVSNVPALKASVSQDTPAPDNGAQEPKATKIYQYHPQLNKYLLNHNQYTVSSRVQGVMPYARIVVSTTQPQVQQQGK